MKKVSIIIPVYNVKEYLTKCVESVCNQSYGNLEIIIVDDGSNDGSDKVCNQLAKKDNRIKVIHKKNGGLSSARNVGIENATGELIAFIDSDDFISQNMIEQLVTCLQKTNASIACCNYKYYKSEKHQKLHKVRAKSLEIYNSKEAIRKLFYDDYYKFFAWNKIYDIKLFDDIRYPNGKLFEDITTSYKLFSKCEKIVFLSEPLYFYRIREGSITRTHYDERVWDLKWAIDSIRQSTSDKEILIGCLLYELFLINNLMISNLAYKQEFKTFKINFMALRQSVFKSNLLSTKRKLQMSILAFLPNLYLILYRRGK